MLSAIKHLSLVSRIVIAIILGIIVALVAPNIAPYFSLLGDLFIKGLKSVAPILVFVLVISSIANFQTSQGAKNFKPIIIMYTIGMLLAALSAVIADKLFPTTLILHLAADQSVQPPSSLSAILKNLVLSFVSNPVVALAEANFIGILAWALILGVAFRHSSATTKVFLHDTAEAIGRVIKLVIGFAPIGIFGLVTVTFASAGFATLTSYTHLLAVLLGTMFFVAFVINPIMVAIVIKKNPYPLVFKCLKESGVTAFFTRSSAANIPVNLDLARRCGVDESTTNVVVPLGSTINMCGAAVTITTLTLATVNTLGIHVDLTTMLILCIVATISACGASGVAGGSLLLVPVACGLFGIPSEIAMKVVAIGMVISVLQDSVETALNSSTDVLFVIAVDQGYKDK
ncbi:serine/threonine transporter SstT [Acinetobacter sp. MD2(2019)]|uniref:serine/threonine transporter SstT n=1 Tax=Acinetobacter sp. MD2(2019) TaxID=2605273 RepID=UPI002D1F988F|nr:serine/threonine transporter SstT [Acinetobacter sp. MD2(2019)]MEB3754254.1 serine/threonine transporter SstT [Acinetobacter sp. MD2(2019)]